MFVLVAHFSTATSPFYHSHSFGSSLPPPSSPKMAPASPPPWSDRMIEQHRHERHERPTAVRESEGRRRMCLHTLWQTEDCAVVTRFIGSKNILSTTGVSWRSRHDGTILRLTVGTCSFYLLPTCFLGKGRWISAVPGVVSGQYMNE